MESNWYLVHYSEISLKKGNRKRFTSRLEENIRNALSYKGIRINRLPGRLLVNVGDNSCEKVHHALSRVFGVSNYAPAFRCKLDINEARNAALKASKEVDFKSFAIATKRPNKSFELRSVEISTDIGAAVQKQSGAKVDLKNPEFKIRVQVLDREIIVAAGKYYGPGGLPVGCVDRVLCMLSGGIDSPVAAWRMMKRGCRPVFLHFHSAPFTSQASLDKVNALAEILCDSQPKAKLITVPFGNLQQKIVSACMPEYRIVLYRRFMFRIAEKIAEKNRALALVTGEALAQVSSQTLGNIVATETVVNMPIFRPLIGMDKEEIISTARRIGTYEMSIEPHDDCCSFLTPTHPVTRARKRDLKMNEDYLEMDKLVDEAITEASEISI